MRTISAPAHHVAVLSISAPVFATGVLQRSTGNTAGIQDFDRFSVLDIFSTMQKNYQVVVMLKRRYGKCWIVMEHIGMYRSPITMVLQQTGFYVRIFNAKDDKPLYRR